MATRTQIKVYSGRSGKQEVILACRGVEEFIAQTRIPRAFVNGECHNSRAKAVALGAMGSAFAKDPWDIEGEWLPWERPAPRRKQKPLPVSAFPAVLR